MIVILCDSFKAAKDAFDIFISVLENNEPWNIKDVFTSCLCVELMDDLRYIFVDWRLSSVFHEMTPDILGDDEFFEDLEEHYGLYD